MAIFASKVSALKHPVNLGLAALRKEYDLLGAEVVKTWIEDKAGLELALKEINRIGDSSGWSWMDMVRYKRDQRHHAEQVLDRFHRIFS